MAKSFKKRKKGRRIHRGSNVGSTAPYVSPVAEHNREPRTASRFDWSILKLRTLTRALPLFVGAFTASGFILKELAPFALCFVGVLLPRLIFETELLMWLRRFRIALYLLSSCLILSVYTAAPVLGAGFPGAILLALALAIAPWNLRDEERRIKVLVLRAICQIIESVSLAILGVYTQSGALILLTGVLGLIPGSLLAGQLLIRSSQALELQGYKRSFLGAVPKIPFLSKRQGEGEVNRPGALSQLCSLFLVVLPSSAAICASVHILPVPFIGVVGIVYYGARLSQQYFLRQRPDLELLDAAAVFAFLSNVLMLFTGLLSRG